MTKAIYKRKRFTFRLTGSRGLASMIWRPGGRTAENLHIGAQTEGREKHTWNDSNFLKPTLRSTPPPTSHTPQSFPNSSTKYSQLWAYKDHTHSNHCRHIPPTCGKKWCVTLEFHVRAGPKRGAWSTQMQGHWSLQWYLFTLSFWIGDGWKG